MQRRSLIETTATLGLGALGCALPGAAQSGPKTPFAVPDTVVPLWHVTSTRTSFSAFGSSRSVRSVAPSGLRATSSACPNGTDSLGLRAGSTGMAGSKLS